jgi:glycerol-3-phosphate dehydrogenase subunit B
VENLYAIGAGLAGFNPVKEGCGAGVSMLSAVYVSDNILKK